MIPKFGLGFIISLALIGCAAQEWRIRDAEGQVQKVNDVRFEPKEKAEFRVGNSQKWIEARQIQWLEIDPGKVISDQGRIYYGARILLQDGSRFPDSASSDTLNGVMLAVDSRLVATAQAGRVEISLAQLREMGTLEYYAPPEVDEAVSSVGGSSSSISGAISSSSKAP